MRLAITTKDKFSKYSNYHYETEPLFLDPDGTRTRFPIGWKGVGRYLPGSLKVYTCRVPDKYLPTPFQPIGNLVLVPSGSRNRGSVS